MSDRSQADALSLTKYGVGQPVLRTEDPVLLRGEGRYTDDLNEPGQAYAYIVRSPHAHGILRKVNTARRRRCRACSRSTRPTTSPPTARTSAGRSSTATARR